MARRVPSDAAAEKQAVMEQRARYYAALRAGCSQEDAVLYANKGITPPELGGPERRAPTVQSRDPTRRPFEPRPLTPAAAPAPTAPAEPDDLMKINGIGSNTVKRLADMGVTTYKQIAGWSAPEAERYDKMLGLRGRITREDWVGQAKKFAST